jgi:Dolichyl-phosphate-mannose-protein mannosyltransferase
VIPALRRQQPAPAPRPGRLRQALRPGGLAVMLRRHWLAAAFLLAGLALRMLAQVAYQPALFYIDSTRYLYHSGGSDPVGYRLPLKVILIISSLNGVAAVQHLLGLMMAVALYWILLRRGCPRWLAALAIAPVLLDAYQLQIEQTIMPDVWFEALIVAGLVVLLWQRRPPLWAVLAAGLALGASATVRQVGEILLLPALGYVLIAVGGWRRRAGYAAAACAAFAVPIIGYSSLSLALTGHFWLSHSGATTAYGRMAAAADCATLRLPADEERLCPTPAQQATGPDQLEHSASSPLRPYYANLPSGEASRLVTAFNRQVLSQQPLTVARAVGRDALKLFALTRTTSPGDTPISRWQFQDGYPTYPPDASRQVIATAGRSYGGGGPAVDPPLAAFLRDYQLGGGYTPGPLLAIAVLAGLVGSVSLARRRPVTQPAAIACFLFTATAVAVLLVSDLFEFSWRYQLPALVTLPPAGALGITVSIGMVSAARAVRTSHADGTA